MSRKARIYYRDKLAGTLEETDEGGYKFIYDSTYVQNYKNLPISLTIPLQDGPFESKVLFPFFDGLIPEGWLLDLSLKNWKLDQRDRFGILLETCGDCIGAISVKKSHD